MTNQLDIVNQMVEVTLPQPDNFLIVRETLTRIGLSDPAPGQENEKALVQLCHILHKQGRYFITHYKELFALDGHPSTMKEDDITRRNLIIKLLVDWKLIILKETVFDVNPSPDSNIKIIPYHEKEEWVLIPKYHLGKKRIAQRS